MSLSASTPRFAAYEAALARGGRKVREQEAADAIRDAARCLEIGDEIGALARHRLASHHEEQAALLGMVAGGLDIGAREPSVRVRP